MEDKYIIVSNVEIAVELFKKGYQIIDLAQDKKRTSKTIFFFKDENNIKQVREELKRKYL